SESMFDLWNRIAVATDNKTLTILLAELNASTKASIISPIVPGLFVHSHLTRSALLKVAGLGGAFSLIRQRSARAVSVFTENFSGGTEFEQLNQVPSYTNWFGSDESAGPDAWLTVIHTGGDRVESFAAGTGMGAFITAGGIPTGNQRITALCNGADPPTSMPTLLTRADTNDRYEASFNPTSNTVDIVRVIANVADPVLASEGRVISFPATCSLEAAGTGATVNLTAIGGATSSVTYADVSGSRLTAGAPGIRIYDEAANVAYITNVDVDNLVGAPAVAGRRRGPIQQ